MEDNGPLPRYRSLLKSGAISPDSAQELAMEKLQLLHLRLANYDPGRSQGWTQRLFARSQKETPTHPHHEHAPTAGEKIESSDSSEILRNPNFGKSSESSES